MTLPKIFQEFKNLSQLPRMDCSKRPALMRKSLNLQERIQAVRQRYSLPVLAHETEDETGKNESELNRPMTRGSDVARISCSEPTGNKRLKRKHSPAVEEKKSAPSCSYTTNVQILPARSPRGSPRRKPASSDCKNRPKAKSVHKKTPLQSISKPKKPSVAVKSPIPLKTPEVAQKPKGAMKTILLNTPEVAGNQKVSMKSILLKTPEVSEKQKGVSTVVLPRPELTPKQKSDAVPLKSPLRCSPRKKPESSTLRCLPELRTKTPISDRVNKFREKLSAEANNKTDTVKPGTKRALRINSETPPPENQNKTKKGFTIPKVRQKSIEEMLGSPRVEKSVTQEIPEDLSMDMDIDFSAGPHTIEDMDWEISEVRRELIEPSATSKRSPSNGDSMKSFDGQWIIAIDTNVFISDLSFVQALRDTDVTGLGMPVIYVPHRVLSELDALKDRSQLKSESVARSARKAVTYLNACLMEKHPRIKGQSISDYIAMKDLTDMSADDKILLSCLQLKKIHQNKLLVFISNDTNLRNKALIEDIETFSVESFEKFFLSGQNDLEKMNHARLEWRLKNTIKIVLTEILENELKSQVSKMNNLDDAIDLFIQKWKSNFSSALPVPAEEQLQKMKATLQQEEKGMQLSLVTLLDAAKMFITHFYVRGKIYFKSIEKTMKVFNSLRPLALEVDNGLPEEKHLTGGLEAVFRLVWEDMYLGSDAINQAKEAHDPSFELRERHFLNSLSHLIEVLGKIMDTSLFEISSSPLLSELAAILALCTNDDKERIYNLLVHVCTTIDGQNMISNAFKIFQAAYNNCSTENSS